MDLMIASAANLNFAKRSNSRNLRRHYDEFCDNDVFPTPKIGV